MTSPREQNSPIVEDSTDNRPSLRRHRGTKLSAFLRDRVREGLAIAARDLPPDTNRRTLFDAFRRKFRAVDQEWEALGATESSRIDYIGRFLEGDESRERARSRGPSAPTSELALPTSETARPSGLGTSPAPSSTSDPDIDEELFGPTALLIPIGVVARLASVAGSLPELAEGHPDRFPWMYLLNHGDGDAEDIEVILGGKSILKAERLPRATAVQVCWPDLSDQWKRDDLGNGQLLSPFELAWKTGRIARSFLGDVLLKSTGEAIWVRLARPGEDAIVYAIK